MTNNVPPLLIELTFSETVPNSSLNASYFTVQQLINSSARSVTLTGTQLVSFTKLLSAKAYAFRMAWVRSMGH